MRNLSAAEVKLSVSLSTNWKSMDLFLACPNNAPSSGVCTSNANCNLSNTECNLFNTTQGLCCPKAASGEYCLQIQTSWSEILESFNKLYYYIEIKFHKIIYIQYLFDRWSFTGGCPTNLPPSGFCSNNICRSGYFCNGINNLCCPLLTRIIPQFSVLN